MAILTEEQTLLRDAAKSFIAEKSPVTAFRKLRDGGKTLRSRALARDVRDGLERNSDPRRIRRLGAWLF